MVEFVMFLRSEYLVVLIVFLFFVVDSIFDSG